MDYYQLLGVSKNASEKELKSVKKKLWSTSDKGGDANTFAINEVYSKLIRPPKKTNV